MKIIKRITELIQLNAQGSPQVVEVETDMWKKRGIVKGINGDRVYFLWIIDMAQNSKALNLENMDAVTMMVYPNIKNIISIK